MGKRAKKKSKSQARPAKSQQTLKLAEFIRQNLMTFVIREGMKALDELLKQDRIALCGPAYTKGAQGDPVRWGSADGRLVMGGQRVMVRKPRVRQDGKEVELPSWGEFANEDPLDERTYEQMVLGVSTRNYDRSLDKLSVSTHLDGMAIEVFEGGVSRKRFADAVEGRGKQWSGSGGRPVF